MNKVMNRKLTWVAIGIIVFLLTLVFNPGALAVGGPSVMPLHWDAVHIVKGYHAAPEFLGGFRWWHDTWIHPGTRAFRPLSSHLHWAQCWTGEHYGWQAVALSTVTLFACNCLALVALAWRWTKSLVLTALVALSTTGVRFINAPQDAVMIGGFPNSDFLLCGALLWSALLLLDIWCEKGRGLYLAGAWGCLAAACLSKELAYVGPVMAFALVLTRAPHPRRKAGLIHAGGMAVMVVALYAYRNWVLWPETRSAIAPAWPWMVASAERSAPMLAIQSELWGPLFLAAVLLVWAVGIRLRERSPYWYRYAAATTLLLFLGLLAVAPEVVFSLMDQPGNAQTMLASATDTAMIIAGYYLIAVGRTAPGMLSLAIYFLIRFPLISAYTFAPAYHYPWYRMIPTLFIPVHLAVVAKLGVDWLRLPRVSLAAQSGESASSCNSISCNSVPANALPQTAKL